MKMKLLSVILFTFFALIILSNPLFAQFSGELSGKVLDENMKPFPYASVSLLNAKDSVAVKGGLTDDNGRYEFKGLSAGKYLLAFYVVGYQKVYHGPHTLSDGSSSISVAHIQLSTDVKLLKGVEIVQQKPLVERQIDKTVLHIENSVLATGNNALEILGKAPGVTVDKDGKLALRGKQGVNVMLDGKPANLSAEQLANLLRATEGNAIQSIELITNPSAKYDAAGNSGIINIKLKKNRNYGLNGAVTAGGSYGTHPKVNGGLDLNYRNKKFNVYGNGNYSFNKRFNETDIVRVNGTKEDQTYFNQSNHNVAKRNNRNYKAGMDYFINDNNTIGFLVKGYEGNGPNTDNVLTLIGDQPARTDSSVVAENRSHTKYSGITYNLNYRSVLDTSGREISADVDYSRHSDQQESTFNNRYKNADGSPLKPDYIFRNASPSIVKIYGVKIDYIMPLNKDGKIEFGGKTSFVETDNNFVYENFLNGKWENEANRSNRFIYDENINAAYVNLKKKFNMTTLQLGLRAEQTRSKGNSVTENKVVNRDYLNLFPSVFLNHELTRDHELGFSYSRRIDRPDYGSLNPFIYYLDLYSYRYGNPFLKPQYTNAFELSYSFKKNLNVTFGYSRTNDVMTEVLLTDTAKKTIFISVQNLARQDAYNMNVSYPVAITKWWSSNNNLTVFYNRFQTPDLLGSPYSSGKLAFNLNTNQTITVNPTTKIEWSGYFSSKQIFGTLLTDPRYNIDMGVSKSLLENKLSLKFAANDIFKLQRNKIVSTLPSQNYVVSERWESRIFRLTCTYRFGSNEVKAARQRSAGSESESKRVKSSN